MAAVRARTAAVGTVLVVLDSNHTLSHIYEELSAYGPLVTPGSYIVAMDAATRFADIPSARPERKFDNPLLAIDDFLRAHPDFVIDPHYTRLHVTSNPNGYRRRLRPDELRRKPSRPGEAG